MPQCHNATIVGIQQVVKSVRILGTYEKFFNQGLWSVEGKCY